MDGKSYAAIVLAAGKGKRMHSSVQKQFLLLDGKPLLYYSLRAFEDSPVERVILVTGEEEISFCRQEIVERFGFSKVCGIVAGGKERYHSVYAGLCALEAWAGWRPERPEPGTKPEPGWQPASDSRIVDDCCVLIHDGARPFVDQGIIGRVMEDAAAYGACAAGMPSKDTVKLADGRGFAARTPDRSCVWTVQTPQAFSYALIRGAYDRMMEKEEYQSRITDDAMVVETMTGGKVKLTEGSYRNLKVTTPEDMAVAEALLRDTP